MGIGKYAAAATSFIEFRCLVHVRLLSNAGLMTPQPLHRVNLASLISILGAQLHFEVLSAVQHINC